MKNIEVYCGGGITGKQKYTKLYRDSCYNIYSGNSKRIRLSIYNCPLPRLVPYNRLMLYIKSIDLGAIFNVYETLCDGQDEGDKVYGCYRSLTEIIVKLAELYLSKSSGHVINWFGAPYTFVISLGSDGKPFGKDETSCAWLISFLNIG